MKEKTSEQILDEVLAKQGQEKTTFAKISFSGKRGPFIVAFLDNITRDYCEMNSLEFKTVSIGEIKTESVPIWEAGAKTEEQINKLPKLNLKKEKEKNLKIKETKKKEKAAKMKATLALKKQRAKK